MSRPLFVLLVEDDEVEQESYKKYFEEHEDIKLIGITASSSEGLEITKESRPDAVILDIQLKQGSGTGLDFLKSLGELDLAFLPCIVTITRNRASSIQSFLDNHVDVDFSFSKQEADYSPEKVVNMIRLLVPHANFSRKISEDEARDEEQHPVEYKQLIYEKIEKEIERVGVSPKMAGKKYLADAIYMLLMDKEGTFAKSVYKEIAKKYNRSEQTIHQGLNSAIAQAWRTNDVEDLKRLYTAKVSIHSGVPTATEFIYYYVDKFRKEVI